MTVDEKTAVEAETTTGAFWATRTILQSPESERKLFRRVFCKRLPAL